MPFTKHIIEPINISQCPLPSGEPNELECLSNLTLANVIRQLSSLGQHAGRIFDELSKDAAQLNNRTLLMHQRIENLKIKCSQLDIQSEEVSLADFQTKKQFKSSVKIDQQVVSRKTMPEAMKIMYNNADPPPALDKLNPYRKDGKDCLKFYTDPEFFFNIWCNELIKDNETRKIEKKRRKTKNEKANQQQHNNISRPILNGQQHIPFSDDPYLLHQQQNPAAQTQQNTKINGLKQQYYQQQANKPHFPNDFDDQSLPPPPMQQLNPADMNYEIYAEATQNLNNGNGSNRNYSRPNQAITPNSYSNNNQKIYSSERPVFPPPPIPTQNHLSDLQQIQQQMIKKKQTDYNINNHNSNGNPNQLQNITGSCDLPPPPSPPSNLENTNHQNENNNMNNLNNHSDHQVTATSQNFMKLVNISENSHKNHEPDMDMPLPPPPMDLTDSNDNVFPPPLSINPPDINTSNNGNHLPPPPPLPPLVESDTVSTSSSASINNTPTQKSANTSKNDDIKVARSSYLDDINQRRFQLKSSKRDANGSNGNSSIVSDGKENADNIQPFVNNSDVAAIIDFIRKFRPHVRDSSDEDEENSDWDD